MVANRTLILGPGHTHSGLEAVVTVGTKTSVGKGFWLPVFERAVKIAVVDH